MSVFGYAPGSLVAVCHGRLAVLLDLPADHELVAGVHGVLIGAHPSVDEVLDVLVSLGLRTVATFAVAEIADAGTRVVVRGGAHAQIPAREPIMPSGLWENRFLDGVGSLTLATGEGGDGVRLPLDGGIVFASAVTLGADAAVQTSATTAGDAAQVVRTAGVGSGVDFGPVAEREGDLAAGAGSAETSDSANGSTGSGEVLEEVGPPVLPAGAVVEATGALPDFDHLFGATQVPLVLPELASAEAAGPVPTADQTGSASAPSTRPGPSGPAEETLTFSTDDAAASGSGPNDTVSPPPAPEPVLPSTPVEPVAASAPITVAPGIIAGLPWEQPGFVPGLPGPATAAVPAREAAPRPAVPTMGEAAHPGALPTSPRSAPEMTIDRDQLIEHGGVSAPLVVAARCPAGHLSPAYAGHCRVCGQALAAQQPFEVPRPSLGVLRLSNGDTVALDRSAVLGRNPRLPDAWTGEQPNLVKIHDPNRDVSGQHLEVRLDFWHVLVRDLGSTNGTEVVLPGAAPVALRAHDAMAIEPGTRVILAGVFEFTYEVDG